MGWPAGETELGRWRGQVTGCGIGPLTRGREMGHGPFERGEREPGLSQFGLLGYFNLEMVFNFKKS